MSIYILSDFLTIAEFFSVLIILWTSVIVRKFMNKVGLCAASRTRAVSRINAETENRVIL